MRHDPDFEPRHEPPATPGGSAAAAYKIVDLRATQLPGPNARDRCRKCPSAVGYLARYIQANGHVAIRWVCRRCEDYGTAGDLPRDLLAAHGIGLYELPIRVNHYDPDYGDECCLCGRKPAEWHHWAPVAIFPDWPWNLGVYLCADHHREWHDRMRANGLRWPHEAAA